MFHDILGDELEGRNAKEKDDKSKEWCEYMQKKDICIK